jgi:hypothetical protein
MSEDEGNWWPASPCSHGTPFVFSHKTPQAVHSQWIHRQRVQAGQDAKECKGKEHLEGCKVAGRASGGRHPIEVPATEQGIPILYRWPGPSGNMQRLKRQQMSCHGLKNFQQRRSFRPTAACTEPGNQPNNHPHHCDFSCSSQHLCQWLTSDSLPCT